MLRAVIGLVLVSHGELAPTLLEVASQIIGPIEAAIPVAVARHESLADVEERVRDAIRKAHRGHGVLVLADVFGGSATNVAVQLMGDLASELVVEVLAGVNLPMVLKAGSAGRTSTDVRAHADLVRTYGQRNVIVAGEALRGRAP